MDKIDYDASTDFKHVLLLFYYTKMWNIKLEMVFVARVVSKCLPEA